jgi:hypothetical protein
MRQSEGCLPGINNKNIMDAQEKQSESETKAKKGSGSFRIPRKAVEILIQNCATGWQIGIFLTIARYTDASGKFSSAGYKAIHQATGASPGTEGRPGRGRQIAADLLKIGRYEHEARRAKKKSSLEGILYTAEEWQEKTGESIPEIDHELHKVRWVLNSFETDDWVWFPNSLTDGYGRFRQPLKRLKQCGDIAARLLLFLYASDNMEEFGGIPPNNNVYKKYKTHHVASRNGYSFWETEEALPYAYHRLFLPVLCLNKLSDDKDENKKQFDPFWNALYSLENSGFMYECVTVMDGASLNQDSRPMYDLVTRPKHGHPLKGEEGMLDKINQIFIEFGYGSESRRFYSKYPVISIVGVQPLVIGIYRLRFRVANPKNYPVRAAWRRIHEERKYWDEELLRLLGVLED